MKIKWLAKASKHFPKLLSNEFYVIWNTLKSIMLISENQSDDICT